MTVPDRRRLDQLSSEEVVKACEQNYIDYWRCAGATPFADFSEEEGITRCVTGLPQDIFNVVLRCDLDERSADAAIDNAIDYFRSRRIPLIWHVGLLTQPSDIGRRLEERGHPHDYDLTAMAADLEGLESDLPSGVAERTVSTPIEARLWAECLASSWDSPKEVASWMMRNPCFDPSRDGQSGLPMTRRMYLGYLNGQPVSASMLFWSDDIAGLQAVGTVRTAQGKGAGTAVVSAALRDASSLGFKFVVVLSTVEGVSLYKKNGFRTFGKLPEHSMDFRPRRS